MATVFSFAATLLGLVVQGWTIYLMWGWFAVPLGASSAAGPWHGIGIAMLFFAVRGPRIADLFVAKGFDQEEWLRQQIYAVLYPLFTLAVGWVIAWFGGML